MNKLLVILIFFNLLIFSQSNKKMTNTIIPAKKQLKNLKVASGYKVNLFASEKDFPIANPMAMKFDSKGRLWIASSPTYPHYLPGKQVNDKIVVLEDTNNDGVADKHTVFADKLYIPTGFVITENGIYLAQQGEIWFLED